ncbi:MmyB family transcriptional regulator [Nocardia suismassiliense]|uniref:MmyB family transcriptional regulator n=1 Tax=Nocardia suismassiliense TaxID=2077092 RepID=UPI00131F1645|nr:helix-turn-helix domain-containing protein [Nocardia suismassiliense]
MGTTLRSIRDSLGLTRLTAHNRHGVSYSYLYEIEADKCTLKLETLEALISGYKVDPLLARHLRELRSAPAVLMPRERLRRRVTSNPDWMSHLDDLQERGVLAAYLDPFWNVLACNELFLSVMPGLEKTCSIAEWLFSPIAQEAWVDWEKEAAWNVAYDKAILGLYRESQQARDLVRHLGPNSEFRRMWASSVDVNYGRDSDSLLHVRHPPNNEIVSYWLSFAPMVEDMTILLATAIPKPYAGPRNPSTFESPTRATDTL